MKHCRYLVLFICIMLSLVYLPFKSYAIVPPEDSAPITDVNLSKEDINAIAISAFPEYAAKILSQPTYAEVLTALSDTSPELTYSETRTISDNEEITYLEYSNGTYGLLFNSYQKITSSSNSGYAAVREANFWVTYSLSSDVSYVNNFQYQLVSGNYDSIISTGYTYAPTLSPMLCSHSLTETATAPAYAEYLCYFPSTVSSPNGETNTIINVYLRIQVGNDSMSRSLH